MHFTTPTNVTAITRAMEEAILVSGNTLERKTFVTCDGDPITEKLMPPKYYFERSQLFHVLLICKITPTFHHRCLTVTPDTPNKPEGYEIWKAQFDLCELMVDINMDYILERPRIGRYRLIDYADPLMIEAANRLNVSLIARYFDD